MTTPAELLGNGVLAFTIDQGAYMQRYQGIVEMNGESLEAMAETYFRQSEQIPTLVRLSVAELFDRDEGQSTPKLAGRRHCGAVPAASPRPHAPARPSGW
jgi:molecular chaperone Hsp33